VSITELNPPVGDDQHVSRLAPPHDFHAERAVLGACLLAKTAVDDVFESGLRGRDFYRPGHETVWDAIRALTDRREPVDGLTVVDELVRTGSLAQAGGPAYLHTLQESTPTAANAGYYAKIVRERATLRRLVAAGTKIAQLGYATEGGDVDEIVNTAQQEVAAVADARHMATVDTLTDISERALGMLEGGFPAVPTPWASLNHLIDGLRPSYFYATGARPGAGKTVFALQWALSYARQQRDNNGPQVAYYTFEMSSERLYLRALACASGVSQTRMRKQRLTDDDWRRIMRADDYLRTLPIVLQGASGSTPQELRARAKRLHRERHVGLLVVDHIGLTRSEKRRDNRQAEISEAADIFLAVGHELSCSVHVLTQLNRGPATRSDQRPVPTDVRDSDRIEQNADVLMLLHRDKDKSPDVLDVGVPKNRDGEEGGMSLEFVGDLSQINDKPWSPGSAA
jgi:replicative DNA helicase